MHVYVYAYIWSLYININKIDRQIRGIGDAFHLQVVVFLPEAKPCSFLIILSSLS